MPRTYSDYAKQLGDFQEDLAQSVAHNFDPDSAVISDDKVSEICEKHGIEIHDVKASFPFGLAMVLFSFVVFVGVLASFFMWQIDRDREEWNRRVAFGVEAAMRGPEYSLNQIMEEKEIILSTPDDSKPVIYTFRRKAGKTYYRISEEAHQWLLRHKGCVNSEMIREFEAKQNQTK